MGNNRERYIETEVGRLHYQTNGNGKQALITLHGYGQNINFLQGLDVLSEEYTIFHFDLPLHGKSEWYKEAIEKEDIRESFSRFLELHDLQTFSLAAFSLGGKILITLLELFPDQINRIVLIAPDGIRINRWYRWATTKPLFQRLFKTIVKDPKIYFILVDALRSVKILDASIARFVKSHMDTAEKRNQVYLVWNAYRYLQLKQHRIEDLLNHNQTVVHLYLGKYDRVIPQSKFHGFIKRVQGLKFYLLPHGHNDLISAVCKRLANDLNT